VIAKTLLLEAFHALDQTPHSPHVRKLLRRVEGGVYARLTAIYRSRRGLNDISVWSEPCSGRNLSREASGECRISAPSTTGT
jgi:hypothetical protein